MKVAQTSRKHYIRQGSTVYSGNNEGIEQIIGNPNKTLNSVIINLIDSRCSIHGLFLCFISLHISNGSVSALLVGHVLYLADLMSAICIPYALPIVSFPSFLNSHIILKSLLECCNLSYFSRP